jgi:hypothetical protein
LEDMVSLVRPLIVSEDILVEGERCRSRC